MSTLTNEEKLTLIDTLKKRFELFPERHDGVKWETVEERLHGNESALEVLHQMEETGGEPDVVKVYDDGSIVFYDCFKECPEARKSLCYDQAALEARKKHKPAGSAVAMAKQIGAELINEEEYFYLQTLGDFDTKTSNWLLTEPELRAKKGAIFGDKRYGRTFIYHNGADSYYASRGFRTKITI